MAAAKKRQHLSKQWCNGVQILMRQCYVTRPGIAHAAYGGKTRRRIKKGMARGGAGEISMAAQQHTSKNKIGARNGVAARGVCAWATSMA